MILFSNTTRTEIDSAGYAESHFIYLDRSARPEAQEIRKVLENWFCRYPDSEKDNLIRRFRSKDDNNFLSAFFELYLHELFLCLNYSVVVHPAAELGSTKHPDFLVKNQIGEEFYVEAVLAKDESDVDTASEARMNVVYDVINKLESLHFLIGMNIKGAPKTSPPTRKLKDQLSKWLEGLNPESIIECFNQHGLDALPKLLFSFEDWEIEFKPIPKSVSVKEKTCADTIGLMTFDEWKGCTCKETIRDAIRKKASRYGLLEKPYIIALNVITIRLDHTHVMEALFGTEQYTVSFESPSEHESRMTRARDGVLFGPDGPQNTRVSAVLVVKSVNPWNIAFRDICIYHNPWARKPYSGSLAILSEVILKDGFLKFKQGKHPLEVFGLIELNTTSLI